MKKTSKFFAIIVMIAMLIGCLTNMSFAMNDNEISGNNVGNNLGEQQNPGENVPNDETPEYTVNFGSAEWTVNGTKVTAAIWGMDDLSTAPVKIKDNEDIKLDNFDSATMQIKVSAPDGFWTTLSIEGDRTQLRKIPEGVTLPGGKDVVLSFSVEAKPNDDEQDEPKTVGGDEDIEFDIEFTDTYINVNMNDLEIISDREELINKFTGTVKKAGTTKADETNVIEFITTFNANEVKEYVINGVTYTEKNALGLGEHTIAFEVPGAKKYTIRGEGIPDPNKPNTIIWANVDADKNAEQYAEDMVLTHGTARVIAVYDDANHLVDPKEYVGEKSNQYGVDDKGFGWVYIKPESRVIFEFVPEYGYQLTSVKANGYALEPQESTNQYEYVMPRTNVHFAAEFTKTEDIVKADSKNITSGEIKLDENSMAEGTAQLEVKDADIDENKIKDFENAAEGYEIKNFIDIDLYQIFYKGKLDAKDVWANKIDELDSDALISLKLQDGIKAEDIVIVHNVHDGDKYEIIKIESYDEKTNTITFKAKSFSKYAIATKEAVEPENIKLVDEKTKASIEFVSEDGHTTENFEFTIMELGNLSEEEIKMLGITKAEYDEILKLLKDNCSKEGTFLKLFNIEVRIPEEDRGISEGPFTIRLPYTEDMKAYDTFKLAYVDEEDFSIKDVVELKLDGNFLVGTLKHLSPYVLIGKVTEKAEKEEAISTTETTKPENSNPITGDNIIIFASIFTLSTLALGFELVSIKKSRI